LTFCGSGSRFLSECGSGFSFEDECGSKLKVNFITFYTNYNVFFYPFYP
jgi:hypothetical protein